MGLHEAHLAASEVSREHHGGPHSLKTWSQATRLPLLASPSPTWAAAGWSFPGAPTRLLRKSSQRRGSPAWLSSTAHCDVFAHAHAVAKHHQSTLLLLWLFRRMFFSFLVAFYRCPCDHRGAPTQHGERRAMHQAVGASPRGRETQPEGAKCKPLLFYLGGENHTKAPSASFLPPTATWLLPAPTVSGNTLWFSKVQSGAFRSREPALSCGAVRLQPPRPTLGHNSHIDGDQGSRKISVSDSSEATC